MASRHDPDRFGLGGVPGDLAVVVTIGADQIGKHLRVTRIRLGATDVVPFPIPRRSQRVDRVHLIAGRDQRRDPQTTISLDPDDHLCCIHDVVGDELVEHPDPVETLGQPAARELLAVVVHQMDVVMILSPIVAHEHCHQLSLRSVATSQETPGGDLMDQCSTAQHPTSATGIPVHRPGHDLALGIKFLEAAVLTGQRLGTSLSLQPV